MTTAQDILKATESDAARNGYFVCPDPGLLKDLLEGLATNADRYGYPSCPCRMASGAKTYDADIICPCEYRDADVAEHGMCFCGLYVSKAVRDDPARLAPVPERRSSDAIKASMEIKTKIERGEKVEDETHEHVQVGVDAKGIPIWRCTVCGYLCARERPPPVCPICKVKADKFEKFGFGQARG